MAGIHIPWTGLGLFGPWGEVHGFSMRGDCGVTVSTSAGSGEPPTIPTVIGHVYYYIFFLFLFVKNNIYFSLNEV